MISYVVQMSGINISQNTAWLQMVTFICQWRQRTHSYKKQNGQKTDLAY